MIIQKENEIHPKLVTDIFDMYIRAYLRDANEFKSGSLKMSYIPMHSGVTAVVGTLEGENHIIHSFLFDKFNHSFETAWKWLDSNKRETLRPQVLKLAKENKIIKFNFMKITEINSETLGRLSDENIKEMEAKLNKLWQISFKTNNLNREAIFNAYEILIDEFKKREIIPDKNDLSKITLTRLDLGCGDNKSENYFGIDIKQFGNNVDQIYDLNFGIPIEDNSQDVVNAANFLEFIEPENKIRIINEIYRVLKPDGLFRFKVASTDGRGAFQDPNIKSFWNENSFLYFTGQLKFNIDKPKFKIMKLKTLFDDKYKTATTIGYLKAIK